MFHEIVDMNNTQKRSSSSYAMLKKDEIVAAWIFSSYSTQSEVRKMKPSDGEEEKEKKEKKNIKNLKNFTFLCFLCVGVFTFDKERRIFLYLFFFHFCSFWFS